VAVIVHVALHGDPFPKPRPRAMIRKKKDGTPFARIYTPDSGKVPWRKVEDALAMQVRAGGFRGPPETAALEVALKFFTATAVRGDIDNLVKTVLDALNGVVWKDDKQITALYAEVTEKDPRPRTEIFVRHAAGTQTALDLEVA
jgi:Holliday junction resolvase RusA-like endonuclease